MSSTLYRLYDRIMQEPGWGTLQTHNVVGAHASHASNVTRPCSADEVSLTQPTLQDLVELWKTADAAVPTAVSIIMNARQVKAEAAGVVSMFEQQKKDSTFPDSTRPAIGSCDERYPLHAADIDRGLQADSDAVMASARQQVLEIAPTAAKESLEPATAAESNSLSSAKQALLQPFVTVPEAWLSERSVQVIMKWQQVGFQQSLRAAEQRYTAQQQAGTQDALPYDMAVDGPVSRQLLQESINRHIADTGTLSVAYARVLCDVSNALVRSGHISQESGAAFKELLMLLLLLAEEVGELAKRTLTLRCWVIGYHMKTRLYEIAAYHVCSILSDKLVVESVRHS